MFTFIHTYTNESFEGLLRQGLWREGDGLKLMHTPYNPEEYGFNRYAAVGSPLYRILEEYRCPFYIDRLQGGMPYPYAYEFDAGLIREYRKLLGDQFWGFQMHEWASNYRFECFRVQDAMHKWRFDAIRKPMEACWKEAIERAKNDHSALFVESWSVEEWSHMDVPKNEKEFLSRLHRLWSLRRQTVGAPLIPVDSYYLAPKLEIAGGAKLLLPEVGWQIPGTRVQIAYTRGMAKAAKIRWGIYYECWGGQKDMTLTIPYCSEDIKNEWVENYLFSDVTKNSNGRPEQGGSSRSLQERIWLHAYVSGATVLGEEYGVCNTFRNLRDYELGAYGRVKKSFLDFVAKYPDLGVTYTPIAIVLPAEMEVYAMNDDSDMYMQYPLDDAVYRYHASEPVDQSLSHKIRAAKEQIGRLFYNDMHAAPQPGRDNHCLQSSPYPDVFDIIHGDTLEGIDRYEYLIDLTGSDAFAKQHKNTVTVDELPFLLKKLLPCTMNDKVHYTINRGKDGWYVLVMNHEGVICDNYDGDHFDPQATVSGEILLRDAKASVNVLEGSGKLSCENGRYTVTLGAGEWLLLSLHETV